MSEYGDDTVDRPGNGQAIAALVLGLVAIPLMCIPYIAIPCAILAIIFGAVGRSKATKRGAGGKGMATAGLALGIIGILMPILVIGGLLALLGVAASDPELQAALEQGVRDAMENAQDADGPVPADP